MTKKDYQVIAQGYRDYLDFAQRYETLLAPNSIQAVSLFFHKYMITALEKDNPKFDRDKFINYITK